MQQQHQLWATVQSSPQETEVKTAVIASAERSMLKFQEHQGNTLRVHQDYLNHQAKYVQNFFFLTQQGYGQFLSGDYIAADDKATALNSSRDERLVVNEPVAIAPEKAAANGNGHYKVLNSIEANGNGHYSGNGAIAIKTASSNGHHPVLNSPETAINGNGHYAVSELIETEISKSNGHHPEPELINENELPGVSTVAPSTAPEIDFATLSTTLLDVVSDKTGYPAEMLELDMDMEADLGIDSIKRVEILGALQEEMPDLPQPNLEDLGDLRTLNQIIEYLRSFDGQAAKVAAVEAEVPESIEATLLNIVSEKTGYPLASLNLKMNLKADLGVDRVKHQTIFDSLQEQIPDLLPTDKEKLEIAELATLAEVLDYLNPNPTQKKTPVGAIK